MLGIVGIGGSILLYDPIGVPLVVAAFTAAFITALRVQWNAHERTVLDGLPRCVACGYDLRGLKPGTPCPECGNTRLFLDCRRCTYDLRGLANEDPCPNCGWRESDGPDGPGGRKTA